MQKYKYYTGGLEDMATKYILVFSDGTQIPMDEATDKQISHAISIVKMKEADEAPIKNP